MRALAQRNRLQIVQLLRQGPQPVGAIVDKLHLRQPAVSKHLHVLSEAGLVEAHADAQKRIYSLQTKPLQELDAWLEGYRTMWEARLDRLDDYLSKLQEGEIRHGKRK